MPVTVTVNEPLAEEVQERVEVPEPPVTLVGDKVQDRPVEGDTVAVKATVPVNPLTGAIVIVEVPVPPTVRLMLVGLAVIVKSCGAVTVTVTLAE